MGAVGKVNPDAQPMTDCTFYIPVMNKQDVLGGDFLVFSHSNLLTAVGGVETTSTHLTKSEFKEDQILCL